MVTTKVGVVVVNVEAETAEVARNVNSCDRITNRRSIFVAKTDSNSTGRDFYTSCNVINTSVLVHGQVYSRHAKSVRIQNTGRCASAAVGFSNVVYAETVEADVADTSNRLQSVVRVANDDLTP